MDKTWLESCLAAGEFLYGELVVTVLQKLYATRGEQISKEEIMECYDESYMMLCDVEMFTPLIATEGEIQKVFKEADRNGNPYASLHYDLDGLQYLRRGREPAASEDYWMSASSQIMELAQNGYISSPDIKTLEDEIRWCGGDTEFLKGIWGMAPAGKLESLEAINAVFGGGICPEAHGYKPR